MAQASDTSPHESLARADQAQPWHAVGRLDFGNGFCTGAMISPKLVLTAAHCVYDKRRGAVHSADEITFKAGYRNGRAVATRQAKRFVAHPDYDHTARNTHATIANDIAVIELKSPILLPSVIPFEQIRRPAPHARVMVVSYARGRAEIPALEDGCKIHADRNEVLEYTCDIDSGSSGSPVFVMTNAGPKIASVMSSTLRRGDSKYSAGVTLGHRLEKLVRALETTNLDPRFQRAGGGASLADQLGRKAAKTSRLPQIKR